jgi:sodium/proline symporter
LNLYSPDISIVRALKGEFKMTSQMVAQIIAFVLYLGMMVFVGLRSARGNKSASDFFLGGRKVGPWVTALSAEASDSSAWLLMGLPGLCYLGGFKETFWTAIGLIVGTYLAWLFVAKNLRKCSIAFDDSITIPEFLTNRFKDKSHVLTIVSVFFIVVFFTIYTASGFVACAKLFRSVFGLDWNVGLLIGFVIILSYTIMGGYKAVCTTDFIQGALIFVAFVASGVIIIWAVGGAGNAVASVNDFANRAINGDFGETFKAKFIGNKSFSAMSAVSAFAWCLGYFGMPHIIIRFMGCRSNREITTARRVGIVWMIISYVGTFIIGTVGTVYLLKHGILLGADAGEAALEGVKVLGAGTQEAVFSETMLRMYPAFIAGIFLCAILAAAMSTADSQLLSASSAIAQDVYKGIIKKDADEKKVLLVSRISVFVVAILGLLLALNPNSSIFNLVSFAWSGFGGTFGPLILLALYWRKATAKGAVAGLIAGGVTDVVWHYLPASVCPIFGVYEILPAFIMCLVVAVVVSLCDKNKDPEMLKEFDNYKSMKD